MNRRGFLKLLSAFSATVALPVPEFVLADPLVILPEMPITLGNIRRIGAYDIRQDRYIIRLDACNGKDQYGVDFAISSFGDMKHNYIETLKVAETVLRDAIISAGWLASDLIALPTPHGWSEPDWMKP